MRTWVRRAESDQRFDRLFDTALDRLGRRLIDDMRTDPPLALDKAGVGKFGQRTARGDARDAELFGQFLLGRHARSETAATAVNLLTQLQENLMVERRRLQPVDRRIAFGALDQDRIPLPGAPRAMPVS